MAISWYAHLLLHSFQHQFVKILRYARLKHLSTIMLNYVDRARDCKRNYEQLFRCRPTGIGQINRLNLAVLVCVLVSSSEQQSEMSQRAFEEYFNPIAARRPRWWRPTTTVTTNTAMTTKMLQRQNLSRQDLICRMIQCVICVCTSVKQRYGHVFCIGANADEQAEE